MPKSIAEMRTSPSVGLPERPVRMCLAQKLVAEVQSLAAEHEQIVNQVKIDPDKPGTPRRAGQGKPARAEEIEERVAALHEEMREHTGELLLRGIGAGRWRRWVADHPVRQVGLTKEGAPIWNPVDEEIAYGYCNADDLLDELGSYVVSWNGEPLADGEWDFILTNAAPGDINEAVKVVVQMHEFVGAKAPLSQGPSSKTTPDVSASNSPSS